MAPGNNQHEINSDEKWRTTLELLSKILDNPATGLALLAFGQLGLRIISSAFFANLSDIGFVLIIMWAVRRLPDIISKGQIVEQRTTLIPNCEGMGASITEITQQLISQTDPSAEMKFPRRVAPSLLHAVFGIARPFLVISSTNPKLKPFSIYIGTADYGPANLQIACYVVRRPSFEQRAMAVLAHVPVIHRLVAFTDWFSRSAMAREGGISGLDIYGAQDLQAFITNTRNCLMQAIENVVDERNLDSSYDEPKGFSGIS